MSAVLATIGAGVAALGEGVGRALGGSNQIMSGAPGTLIAIQGKNGARAPTSAVVEIDGFESGPATAIITSFSKQAQAQAQMQPTVGGPHYIYSFGQRLTEMSVTLIAFPNECRGSLGAALSSFLGGARTKPADGYKALWAFYQENRVSPENIKPIKLTFSGLPVFGFVTGMTAEATSTNGFPMITVRLMLQGWVDKSALPSSGSGGSSSGGSSAGGGGGGGGSPSTPVADTGTQSGSGSTPGGATAATADSDSSGLLPRSFGFLNNILGGAQSGKQNAAANSKANLGAAGPKPASVRNFVQTVSKGGDKKAGSASPRTRVYSGGTSSTITSSSARRQLGPQRIPGI